MRKLLTAVTLVTLFLLITTAPLPASESRTEASGQISSATLAFLFSPVFLGVIPGLPIGDQVRVEWEPLLGAEGEIRNETQDTRARCTVTAFTTAAPSTRLRCTVTESDIAGIGVGHDLQVTVNFSPAGGFIFSVPGLPGAGLVALNPNEVCIKNVSLATGVDFHPVEIEAK